MFYFWLIIGVFFCKAEESVSDIVKVETCPEESTSNYFTSADPITGLVTITYTDPQTGLSSQYRWADPDFVNLFEVVSKESKIAEDISIFFEKDKIIITYSDPLTSKPSKRTFINSSDYAQDFYKELLQSKLRQHKMKQQNQAAFAFNNNFE